MSGARVPAEMAVEARRIERYAEPEWMKKARQAPLYSTYESRQPPEPARGSVTPAAHSD